MNENPVSKDSFSEEFPQQIDPQAAPAPAPTLDQSEVLPGDQPVSSTGTQNEAPKPIVFRAQNVTFIVDPHSTLTSGGSTDLLGSIALPNQTLAQLTESGREVSEDLDPGISEGLVAWSRSLHNGFSVLPTQEKDLEVDYQAILEREGSKFVNNIHHGGHSLRSTPITFSDADRDLSAERGELLFSAFLGQGTPMKTALWGSGFWISMKPPNEDDLLLINHILGEDKIRFGRETHGAVFGNATAYTQKRLVDFAISKIYASSIKKQADGRLLPNNQTFEDIIVATDYPLLLNALNAAMYPRGMRYSIACTRNIEKCKHVNTGVISPHKLELVDENMLTDRQREHMCKRGNQQMTYESVLEYQQAMNFSAGERVKVLTSSGGELILELRVPKISRQAALGMEWIEGIVTLVDNATKDISDEERDALYRKFASSSKLLDYYHWIHSMTFGNFIPLTKTEELKSKLALLSSDTLATKGVLEAIMRYIVKTTVAVVAVPVVECSNCGEPLGEDHHLHQFKNAIILDLQSLFFVQLSRRITNIASRSGISQAG